MEMFAVKSEDLQSASCEKENIDKKCLNEKEDRNEDNIDSGRCENYEIEVKNENISIEENFTHQSGIYDRMMFDVKSENFCSALSEKANVEGILKKEKEKNNDNIDSESIDGIQQREGNCSHNYEIENCESITNNITPFSSSERTSEAVNFDDEMIESNSERKTYDCLLSEETNNRHSFHFNLAMQGVNSKLKNHKCHLCDYATSQKHNLKEHIDAIHSNLKNHKCHLCDYIASFKGNLKRHINAVHKKLKIFKCHLCDYATSWKGGLKQHIDAIHSNLKNHKCHLCDYSASIKQNLKYHIDSFHLNVRNHRCHLCDYAANKKGNLKNHIDAIHLNLKNHKCHFCDYATSRKNDLKIHIDAVHKMFKKFKCHLCDYASYLKGNLRRHVNAMHTNLKISQN